jgi:hypothetical protein
MSCPSVMISSWWVHALPDNTKSSLCSGAHGGYMLLVMMVFKGALLGALCSNEV